MNALNELQVWFDTCPGALIAFSGGVDSSLVAALAHRFLGYDAAISVISASPSLKLSELDAAKDFARIQGLQLKIVQTQEIKDPNYYENPSNRCYFCKHSLYDTLQQLRKQHPDFWILNGTNLDDQGDYRPGLRAADEFSVRSPLLECGLTKLDVRALASDLGLSCWDKPASPCLASRVPYGERITEEKLRQIEVAEAYVQALGFPICRVRHYGEHAKIEVPAERREALLLHAESIAEHFRGIGFQQVEYDSEGFVSGKLNRAIGR